MAPWNPVHHLRHYTDGLRERLVTYFEVNQVQHHPKLVGVTSCDPGVGVTTLAAGLAASLSMTGEGNVLLVNMNESGFAARSFHKGKPGCDLSELKEVEPAAKFTSPSPNQTNGSTDTTNGGAPKELPAVFNDVIPQLKVSGYDYIVFDMPFVSQTSLSPRMSGHMDLVLLVIESEKTNRYTAIQSTALMREARANLFAILNKCRQHVPEPLSVGY